MSEDNEKIRRNPELPVPELTKERDEDLRARSIYAVSLVRNAKHRPIIVTVEMPNFMFSCMNAN